MGWVLKAIGDYFACFGFVVFVGAVVSILFFDGKVENLSTGWIVSLPLMYSYLRGELYHWPKEITSKEKTK